MKTDITNRIKKMAVVTVDGHGAFGEPETSYEIDVDKVMELTIEEVLRILDPTSDKATGHREFGRWESMHMICRHFGVSYEDFKGKDV